MLQTCLGIYVVLALLTFLFFIGTFMDIPQQDEEMKESF